MSRRDFLVFSSIAVFESTVKNRDTQRSEPKKALDDNEIFQELVKFKNGKHEIEGYLAHPKKKGNFCGVLVLHGNADLPEDIRNTAAQMAQLGFVGLAVSSTSREPDASKISRDFLMSDAYIKRYISDGQAGIEFLKTKPSFNVSNGFGIVGFCGGGLTAVRFATVDDRVRAVVAFYAAPKSYEPYISKTDPRPDMIDYVSQVKIPLQFHFGTKDEIIPMADVKKFNQVLQREKLNAEVYIYENAEHGFANFTDSTYRAADARLAEKRAGQFFRKHLFNRSSLKEK